MPLTIYTLSQYEASAIVAAIINMAGEDGGSPVAVAVVDHSGRLLAFTAMDHVMPASMRLARSKAYSAVIGKRDTIHWGSMKKSVENIDFDMRNWTDEKFTGFTGGVIICYKDQVIGGIGVSGRKGRRDEQDTLMQDNELAEHGRSILKI